MENTSTKMSLNHCFQSYETSLTPSVEQASGEFLASGVSVRLVSASYEPAFFWKDNEYFVTQINHTNEFTLVLKVSNVAADLMLKAALGKRQDTRGALRLQNLTELEANILTGYNDFIYQQMKPLFLSRKEINSVLHTIKGEKILYLTFYISGPDETEAGKIILSFPEFILKKTLPVETHTLPLKYDFFNKSSVETSILIGKTRASLQDVKNLEQEDIIILDDSDLYRMYLKDFEDTNINVNPSHSLVLDFEQEDGDENIVNEVKETSKNIWDSLEVDVIASFEKVKMKLGDLREITEGLVVDVASIAGNKVYIEVENKQLAAGELVIIGDKYGVKITEICDEAKEREVEKLEEEAAAETAELTVAKEQVPQQEMVEEYEEATDDDEYDEDDEEEEIEEDLNDSEFELDEEEEEY